ncbi:MAG: ABC transporter permease [Oxalobacteraceae bacterium]|nr:MAG: ABC transporter permease [Oxalobacteraceae bacterium]
MLYSFKVALRYLTSNRGQTSLLILGVAVGVYVFVFMSALIGGLAVLLLDRTVGNIAHVTIEKPDRDPVLLFDRDIGTLFAALKSTQQRATLQSATSFLPMIEVIPQVKTVAGAVTGSGFLTKGEAIAPTVVTGVEAQQVSAIADIAGNLRAGSTDLTIGTALIGSGLANKLGIRVGQTVSIRSERGIVTTLKIGGIFSLGVAGVDDTATYVNIRTARVLFELPDGFSRLEVKLHDLKSAPRAAVEIANATGLKSTPWTEKNQQLLNGLTAQARSGDVIKGFALITIVIGIASALLLSTYRRQSEIGIMRAMGATRRFVVFVFMIQGGLIGLTGALLGAGLGYLSLLPFPPPQATSGAGLPIDIGQGAYGAAILLTLVSSIIAAIWPAGAASRVDPAEVIGA